MPILNLINPIHRIDTYFFKIQLRIYNKNHTWYSNISPTVVYLDDNNSGDGYYDIDYDGNIH